jgi:ribosomal protein S12 methylthiotransferase accessory factor
VAPVVRLSSSLREAPPATVFQRAIRVAGGLGITRVTEITWLDRIGVPVFVAIRPDAQAGSLCVNAGKGLTADEARVGALMEAIEYAWVEPGRAALPVILAPLRQILDGSSRPAACLDLCPVLGLTLDLDASVACVEAQDILTGRPALVPAELVFHPFAGAGGPQYYGTGTNGLASGSSVDEATLHGLGELIERDALSFHRVLPASRPVLVDSLPAPLRAAAQRLDALGFDLHLRALPNPYRVPCFAALVSDRNQRRMTMRGEGCHPVAAIAAVRAVTETIQARLSLIHGGRDDLTGIRDLHAGREEDDVEARYRAAVAAFGAGGPSVDFAATVDRSAEAIDIPTATAVLVRGLEEQGLGQILRVVYTPADYPVQVVRVLVPGLESYSAGHRRVGPRLRAFAAAAGRGL